ncbi:VOC family protein [Chitinophaga sp. RAB17]|uniref:VOC family protein n=1 Tax=Chitinophaga sp. RAB17 TaxID=3233049 RepID=UPI003F8ED9E7
MKNTLGRVVILVRDYDEAGRFYTAALGFHKLYDATLNGQRYLHLAPSPGELTGIWLLQAVGPEQDALVGRQAGEQPLLVLYTDSFNAYHQQLEDHGVTISQGPVITPDATFLHFQDLYGNEIVQVQLPDTTTPDPTLNN